MNNKKITMKPFTFDQIPKMIGKLFEKMERIESLLSTITMRQGQKDELLTISEASKFLNIPVPTTYFKVSRNEIPVNKQGKDFIFISHNFYYGLAREG